MEKLIEPYYNDSFEVSDNKVINFERIVNYKGSDRKAVRISIDDIITGTSTELGIYFDAKWYFVSPINENIFWGYVKTYPSQIGEIFSRMRKTIPSSQDLHAYHIKFKNASSRVSQKLQKLSFILSSK
jgi:hypothetical protein